MEPGEGSMPKSWLMACRSSRSESEGLSTSAVRIFLGSMASSDRQMVVLPVPTSPLIRMKPFLWSIPYWRWDRASR